MVNNNGDVVSGGMGINRWIGGGVTQSRECV